MTPRRKRVTMKFMGRKKGKVSAKPKHPSTVVPLTTVPDAVKQALLACTPQQRVYVIHYCGEARRNQTLAAKLAGVPGSYHAQASTASGWMTDPNVRAAIEAWMDAFALSASEITHALADHAGAHLGPFVKVRRNGQLEVQVKDDQTWQKYRHWVKAIECDPDTGRVIKVILHDRLTAMREMAKILKLYSEAPQLNMNFYAQMSDEELYRELEEARAAVRTTAMLSTN